jgi:hypothetical protein
MIMSLRTDSEWDERFRRAAKGSGVLTADLAREGIRRVITEFEETGAVRFSSAKSSPGADGNTSDHGLELCAPQAS